MENLRSDRSITSAEFLGIRFSSHDFGRYDFAFLWPFSRIGRIWRSL
jgi:hypothetical protein